MMKTLLSEIKWYLQQTSKSRLELILIAVIVLLIYALRVQHNQNKSITNDYRKTDSISRIRLANVHLYYQTQIEACNSKRVDEQVKQNEVWLEKYQDLLEEINRMYKNLNLR